MAFAQVDDTVQDVLGNKRMSHGSFTQASGDVGGTAIATGLATVEYFECTGMVTHATTAGAVTPVILDPGAAQAGYWMAIGY